MLKYALLLLLLAPVAEAAIKAKATHTTYQVRRGSTNLPPAPTTEADCIRRAHEAAETEGVTRVVGANDFQCHRVLHVLVTFGPNPPPPVCPERSAVQIDEQIRQNCPAGTVGTWLQDKTWTLMDYPSCWVQGDWTPAEPPVGMCAPADSDGDGVPDSADQCPTVHAVTPSGCPALPPPGTAALSWTPPTQNTNGTALTNLAGYRISYGTSATAMAQTVQISNAGVSSYTVTGLAPGTWYFAVRAYTTNGAESALSNTARKVVQ